MRPADTTSLRPEADVAAGHEHLAGMFQRLPKGSAAVAALTVRADIEMGVEIDNTAGRLALRVPQKVAEGGFMAAAEDDRNRARLEQPRDDLAERLLRCL